MGFTQVLTSKRTRWILAAGVVAALGWAVAYSIFTSEGQADAGTFSTGSLQLTLNSQTGEVGFSDLNMSGMKPGDEVSAPLQVGNSGTLDFNYDMSTTTSGDSDLADALTIGIGSTGQSGTCTNGTNPSAELVAKGTKLASAAIKARSLAHGAFEYLCFQVQLPASAGNEVQGKSASASFHFVAQPTS